MEELLLAMILLSLWGRWYFTSRLYALHKKRWLRWYTPRKLDREKRKAIKKALI